MSQAISFLTAALLGCLLLATPSAFAHQGDPNYSSVVNGFSPDVPGLSAEVINYDSDLVVESSSDSAVEFLGYEKEPYLRFLPGGTVEVNTRSPAYYLNTDRYGTQEVPAAADPAAKPKWEVVADDGRFDWHDHRSHYMSESLPPQVTDENERTKVFDYSIPMRVDGRDATLDGTLYWVGKPTPSRLPFVIVAVVLVLLIPVALLIRRRRGDGPGSSDDRGDGKDEGGSPRQEEAW